MNNSRSPDTAAPRQTTGTEAPDPATPAQTPNNQTPMKSLIAYLPDTVDEHASKTWTPVTKLLADQRREIAQAILIEQDAFVNVVLSTLPKWLRALAYPYADRYARRAIEAVAQWIDPDQPDPA